MALKEVALSGLDETDEPVEPARKDVVKLRTREFPIVLPRSRAERDELIGIATGAAYGRALAACVGRCTGGRLDRFFEGARERAVKEKRADPPPVPNLKRVRFDYLEYGGEVTDALYDMKVTPDELHEAGLACLNALVDKRLTEDEVVEALGKSEPPTVL